ncbi:hypothetical protein DH2020_045390 [Rehmannia glutinosa]|uniref:Uncharacterized protein n=1 Tax=Rehmannia glutinosa TaxID=99300 RepID=A0ABR0UEA3_REHGL
MEIVENIVIAGAGISGLATSLGLHSIVSTSVNSGLTTSELPFGAIDSQDNDDIWCVNRKVLLETMENELPSGTIRYSSKVVHIQIDGCFKSIHLADGTVLKTKASQSLFFVGDQPVKGYLYFEEAHGFEPKVMQFFGKGVRFGVIPCNDHGVYWFFTFSPSPGGAEKDIVEDPTKLKQLILSGLGKVPNKIKEAKVAVQHWKTASFSKTLGRGLEENALSTDEENEHWRIEEALEKFARERRWRNFDLISTSYVVGFMQQSDGVVMNFLRDKIMAKYLAGLLLKKAKFDCGKFVGSSWMMM